MVYHYLVVFYLDLELKSLQRYPSILCEYPKQFYKLPNFFFRLKHLHMRFPEIQQYQRINRLHTKMKATIQIQRQIQFTLNEISQHRIILVAIKQQFIRIKHTTRLIEQILVLIIQIIHGLFHLYHRRSQVRLTSQ